MKHSTRRIRAGHREKTERRQIQHAFGRNRRDERNRPRHHDADQQFVSVERRNCGRIDDHLGIQLAQYSFHSQGSAGGKHVQGIQTVEHHRIFVGRGLLFLIGQRLRMRAVMDAARMQRSHSGLDVVFAEKVSVVIENKFVVIGIAMEERHAHRRRILFQRTRQKAAHHCARRDEGRMRAGRKMRAMAHHRANIAHIDLPHRQVAFPPHDIQRIERIKDLRIFVLMLDADFPFMAARGRLAVRASP